MLQSEAPRHDTNASVTIESLEIYSTCPQSKDVPRDQYLTRVLETARWSEEIGCTGILIYTDNSILDPWLVAQEILKNTERLAPLVAVQPIYMHPYAVAKIVTSFAHLYGRRVALNMLAGGFRGDLFALGDPTPHDERYQRTTEYTLIIRKLLEGTGAVTLEGNYYSVKSLKLTPPLPAGLFPPILMSGSSAAGLAAAETTGATAVMYPRPVESESEGVLSTTARCGARIGVIARELEGEAWRIANQRFPEDRRGEITHQLATRMSDSVWHKQLDELGKSECIDNVYWLRPYRTYKTFCPYLVGGYQRVSAEIARYVDAGFRTFILDIPDSREELLHTKAVFDLALDLLNSGARQYEQESSCDPGRERSG